MKRRKKEEVIQVRSPDAAGISLISRRRRRFSTSNIPSSHSLSRRKKGGWIQYHLLFNYVLRVLIVSQVFSTNMMVSNGQSPGSEEVAPGGNFLESQAMGRNITSILNNFFDHGYDKRVRPKYGKTPVQVKVSMYIVDISSVSEVSMDFTSDFYFRQKWIDSRLSFKSAEGIESLSVGSEVGERIWVPDTFFANEKSAYFHIATTPNTFIRIYPNGEVLLSMRLTVTASCPMELQYFPMDRQMCNIEVESYGYSTLDIQYEWLGKDAVKLDPGVILPQFRVVGHEQREKTVPLSTGNYSRLLCEIKLVRSMGYYLIQIYIPASLIVVISWVSFWLHRNATPARVQLGVLTVLTMTTLMSSTNSQLPKISYIKSIDVFLGTCFVMVFAALLEYAAVGYIGKRISMRRNRWMAQQKSQEERRKTKLSLLNQSLMNQGGSSFADQGSMGSGNENNGLSNHQLHQQPLPRTHPVTTTSQVQFQYPPQYHQHQFQVPLAQIPSAQIPSESESEAPPLPPPPPEDYEPSIPTFSQHYLQRYNRGPSSSSSSHPQQLLYHRSAEDISTPPLTSPPSPFHRQSRSHRDKHYHQRPSQHHFHRRHSSKHKSNDRIKSANGEPSSSSNVIHYATIRRPHVVTDRCPDGSCTGQHSNGQRGGTGVSMTTSGGAVTMTTPSTYYQSRLGTPGTQLMHRPQEVRLDMIGSKATAPTSMLATNHPSPPIDEMIDIMSPSSTVGGGGLGAGVDKRPSITAQAMSIGRSGGGLGGEKEDYTKSASMTPTPGNLVIPQNMNELFGVSPSDIDKYSRVVFPVCFICFNLMYWMIYLHISKILEVEFDSPN